MASYDKMYMRQSRRQTLQLLCRSQIDRSDEQKEGTSKYNVRVEKFLHFALCLFSEIKVVRARHYCSVVADRCQFRAMSAANHQGGLCRSSGPWNWRLCRWEWCIQYRNNLVQRRDNDFDNKKKAMTKLPKAWIRHNNPGRWGSGASAPSSVR